MKFKIWPFAKHKKTNLQVTSTEWLEPRPAIELLNTPLRQKLLSMLWQKVSMSQDLFNKLYQQPIEKYAELVQLLPASENHHHSHLGGMLDHGLEVVVYAAKLRQSYLLPLGAAPEEQAQQAEAWTAVVLYGALLHDIGKIAVDLQIETNDNKFWFAWNDKTLFQLGQKYRFKYIKNRDYNLHPVMGGLLARHLLPDFALNWLAQYPDALTALMYFINGHYDRSGILGEIIQRADQASVAQNLGGSINNIQERPQQSLPKQILMALRHLLEQQELKLNMPGADGWLTEDALWLMSKNTADKIRAYLMQQGINIPSPNGRLFDDMQAHRLLEVTPTNRAIWSCKIQAEDWKPSNDFTLLKFSPSLIWQNVDQRPSIFSGEIIPNIAKDNETSADANENITTIPKIDDELQNITNIELSAISQQNQNQSDTIKNESNKTILESGEVDDYDFALNLLTSTSTSTSTSTDLSHSQSPQEGEKETVNIMSKNTYKDDVEDIDENKQALVNNIKQQDEISANSLLDWIRSGLISNKLEINSANAKIHMVEGKIFLTSPGIFQQFVVEQLGHKDKAVWKALQNDFQRLKIHKKQPSKNGDSGLNIWTCIVAGPRKKSEIKGYLVEDTSIIFPAGNAPFDNMYLTLKESENEEPHSESQ